MKILLSVLPNFQNKRVLLPHLGNACLKTFLENNLDESFNVKLLDLRGNKEEIKNIWSDGESGQLTYKKMFVSDIYELPLILSIINNFQKNRNINNLLNPNKELVSNWALEHGKLPDILINKLKATNLFALKYINLFGSYDVVCFSLYISNIYLSIFMALLIRLIYPNTKIIFGGPQITQSYSTRQLLLKGAVADFLVIGEGEQPLLEIVNALSKNDKINNIDGVKTLDNLYLPDVYSQVKNLDDLPTPNYENTNFSLYSECSIPIYSNRGCPYNCNYCSEHKLFGEIFRCCSPQKVVNDMNILSEKHGINNFTLLDSLINSSKNWINEFCDILIENNSNFKWGGYFRAELDKDTIIKMKKAGLFFATLGVESFSDKTLRNMNKRKIKNDILDTINSLVENEIKTAINLVIAFPDETDEDFWETLNICYGLKKKFQAESKLNYYSMTVRNFQLRPLSNIFNDYEKMGLIVKTWKDSYSSEDCPDDLKHLFDETLYSFETKNISITELSTRLSFMSQMRD